MTAIWRLSINAFAGRKSRSAFIVAAVTLSAALVAAVSCALASLNVGLETRIDERVGRADAHVRHFAGDRFPVRPILDHLAQTEQIEHIAVQLRGVVELFPLEPEPGVRPTLTMFRGIDLPVQDTFGAPRVHQGETVRDHHHVVLDEKTAKALGVRLGDQLQARIFGPADERQAKTLTLVGITEKTRLEMLDQPQGLLSLETLREVAGLQTRADEIRIILDERADPYAWAEQLSAELTRGMVAESTARITTGVDNMIRANQIIFILASTLAFLSAAFIILTGMTATAAQRQRELAVIRCIGATKRQLAATQLLIGAYIGAIGGAVGVPLGIALAWILTILLPDRLPAGLHLSALGLAFSILGAVIAGLLGASWSAWRAARLNPIPAMQSQAAPASGRAVILAGLVGFAGLATQAAVVLFSPDPDFFFRAYILVGLPAMFLGYFLIAVPLVINVARVLATPVARLCRIPAPLLADAVAATPFRTGFTAAALMVGLALMTSIWTNGTSILKDWFQTIKFPDAFANAVLVDLDQDARDRVEALDVVERTAAITLFKTESDAFGVPSISTPKTSFIAFDPDEFFEMAALKWHAGNPQTAIPRLREGGAVLVAREFLVQREGFGVGDTFTIEHRGKKLPFEIVGAVSSPGLDIIRKYFDFGEEYTDHAIHSVFGTRDDLERFFGDTSIDLLQINLAPPVADLSDEQAVEQIKAAIDTPGVFVGSGREIKLRIEAVALRILNVGSLIAVAAMVIASMGVGNIILASVDARRFEFGVLRAIGGGRWQIARLIAAEALLIAITAAILGLAMGIQGSWAFLRLYGLIAGIELTITPPPQPLALGILILTAITLLAAAPIAVRIALRHPRELLAATRG